MLVSGAFWQDICYPAYYWVSRKGALFRGVSAAKLRADPLALRKLLEEGYGVALQLVHDYDEENEARHVVTLWGFKYDEDNKFKGVFVTDSDDSKKNNNPKRIKNRLRYHPVELKEDNKWYLKYQNKSWQIFAAYALLKKDLYNPDH